MQRFLELFTVSSTSHTHCKFAGSTPSTVSELSFTVTLADVVGKPEAHLVLIISHPLTGTFKSLLLVDTIGF